MAPQGLFRYIRLTDRKYSKANLHYSLKLSPYLSGSRLRSILVSLHRQLSSVPWRPVPLPNAPKLYAPKLYVPPLGLPTRRRHNLYTTQHIHHNSQPQSFPKTTRHRHTRMLLQMISLQLMGHAESTPASQISTHLHWTRSPRSGAVGVQGSR
jgi:hypothetical protein